MNLKKQKQYYSHARIDLLSYLPPEVKLDRVLDVGCGNGATGKILKNFLHVQEVVGIELCYQIAEEAKQVLNHVIIGDVQKINLTYDENYFDCIIFADILEHLYSPWSVLKKMRHYLKDQGLILLSVPNVQHWSIFVELFRGNWEYKNDGILDSTHVRFFTKKSLIDLLQQSGFKILKVFGIMGKKAHAINYSTFGFFSNFLSFRYFVLACKSNNN